MRDRAEALFRSATAEFEAITRLTRQARETCAELRALLDGPANAAAATAEPVRTVAQVLAAAGLSEDDLADLTDELIAAYRSVEAAGDAERRATFERALLAIGRHLAAGLGPRAAGVVLH